MRVIPKLSNRKIVSSFVEVAVKAVAKEQSPIMVMKIKRGEYLLWDKKGLLICVCKGIKIEVETQSISWR